MSWNARVAMGRCDFLPPSIRLTRLDAFWNVLAYLPGRHPLRTRYLTLPSREKFSLSVCKNARSGDVCLKTPAATRQWAVSS
jgi:hypothetical protein